MGISKSAVKVSSDRKTKALTESITVVVGAAVVVVAVVVAAAAAVVVVVGAVAVV